MANTKVISVCVVQLLILGFQWLISLWFLSGSLVEYQLNLGRVMQLIVFVISIAEKLSVSFFEGNEAWQLEMHEYAQYSRRIFQVTEQRWETGITQMMCMISLGQLYGLLLYARVYGEFPIQGNVLLILSSQLFKQLFLCGLL